MKKIIRIIILIALIFLTKNLSPIKKAYAAPPPCGGDHGVYRNFSFAISPNPLPLRSHLAVGVTGLNEGVSYKMYVDCAIFNDYCDDPVTALESGEVTTFNFTRDSPNCYNNKAGTRDVYLAKDDWKATVICKAGTYRISTDPAPECDYEFDPPYPDLSYIVDPGVALRLSGLEPNEWYKLEIKKIGGARASGFTTDGDGNRLIKLGVGTFDGWFDVPGNYQFYIHADQLEFFTVCSFTLKVYSENEDPYTPPEGMEVSIKPYKPKCCNSKTGEVNQSDPNFCDNLEDAERGIDTAIGCFPTHPKAIINWILEYSIYLGGGIAFLLMVWGAFQIIMSAGDPERLKEGQQILGSALAGLLLIILSLFLLRLIGFTILRIPGFG